MKVVWKTNGGLLMEIVESMPEPKPHKNTVATILKGLVEKGYIRVENLGRIHRYHPAVGIDEYSKYSLSNLAKGYFDNSYRNVVSFLVEKNGLSIEDLEMLLQQLKKDKA